jgi:hypothetical protein
LLSVNVETQTQPQPQQQTQGNLLFNHTTATLSEARSRLAATSSGELVFFAGGDNAITGQTSARVDILDISSGKWTTITLSQPRDDVAATSSRNLVFFGGGWDGTTPYSDLVDIYNISSGSWSTASLSLNLVPSLQPHQLEILFYLVEVRILMVIRKWLMCTM